MRTLLIITAIMSVFISAKSKKADLHEKKASAAIFFTDLDSVLEMKRVEMMEYKMR